jgi:hypothetical protein
VTSLLGLAAAFLVFAGAVWSTHAVNRYSVARHGYAPFAMSNALFMLVPHGLLLYAIGEGGQGTELAVTLAGAGFLGMFLLVRHRADGWVGLFTATMLLAGASVLAFSIFFAGLAAPPSGGDAGGRE